jgi:predicted NBD/HSP70 family sugar kinase
VLAARPQLIRALNEQVVLEHVRRQGRVDRRELGSASGLSKPTIAVALANLERDGLIRVAGRSPGGRGPAPVLYELQPDAGFVLGLDVGSEYVRGAVADFTGAIRARGSHSVHHASRSDRIAELVALADELLGRIGLERSRVTQTVIGSPGVYDRRKDALVMARQLPGWERPEVLAGLRRAFGLHTVVENDVNLAALAERELGHGRGVPDFAFLSVGTGVGLGLVVDGKLHRGAHGAAGEIAFMLLGDADGVDRDDARRRGWLESAASAAGIVRAARAAGMRGPITPRRVFAAAERGDARCLEIVEHEAELVARAAAAVTSVVDVDLVVLGGGIGQLATLARLVEANLHRLIRLAPEVRVSALGEDAVVHGCLAAGAELAWRRIAQR